MKVHKRFIVNNRQCRRILRMNHRNRDIDQLNGNRRTYPPGPCSWQRRYAAFVVLIALAQFASAANTKFTDAEVILARRHMYAETETREIRFKEYRGRGGYGWRVKEDSQEWLFMTGRLARPDEVAQGKYQW